MQSNEIKEGDIVCLKKSNGLKMTVGIIRQKERMADCYWDVDNEIKHCDIPVSALRHHLSD